MADLPVVRTAEDAKNVAPGQRVLVEVPGESASQILWLTKMLQDPDDSEAGRAVKRLLAASRG